MFIRFPVVPFVCKFCSKFCKKLVKEEFVAVPPASLISVPKLCCNCEIVDAELGVADAVVAVVPVVSAVCEMPELEVDVVGALEIDVLSDELAPSSCEIKDCKLLVS